MVDATIGIVKIPEPSFTTYLINDKDENILHFCGYRVRLNGSGNLKARFIGLDEIDTQELVALVANPTPGREPFRLANFIQQRGSLKIYTSDMDDFFKINRLVIFAKTLWTSYPG